jgi:alkylated DNA repair protein (DNA oxidative demethylase)
MQHGLLFEQVPDESRTVLADGAVVLHGFAAGHAAELLAAAEEVASKAPFRHMVTPGGFRMSAAMTNCGEAGWISDRDGYRYAAIDPETGRLWPRMPELFQLLATEAAQAGGFSDFRPDACLINRYQPGARLTLHQDRNERDFDQPIVSFSLGLAAVFLFGESPQPSARST